MGSPATRSLPSPCRAAPPPLQNREAVEQEEEEDVKDNSKHVGDLLCVNHYSKIFTYIDPFNPNSHL